MTTVDVSKLLGLAVGTEMPEEGVTVTKVHGLAVGSMLPDTGVIATKVHALVVLAPAAADGNLQRLFMIMG